MSKKTTKAKSPDKLAKTGKTSGVELNESDLGQIRGGVAVKIAPTLK
jgi:hypothetical protein